MNPKQTEILEYLKRNNGILSYRDVKEAGLSYRTYRKMIEQELLEPLGNGLYGLTDNYMDDWYFNSITQSKRSIRTRYGIVVTWIIVNCAI